ncbi:hypothetical protein U8527_05825 [Kordia algicida OT-1]|uniref:Uncharacterized protein n=1 Tax=Kordia algicida OT-1 TaxID=391587 RepID=A9E0T8_9FLAO|nr:hypothetical protein [Kordia algicida]EDP95542.1 hypothetical protein KAOT1_21861 [Kordia algicida OT-1]
MKKKNLKTNGLKLNKRAISNLKLGTLTGGGTNSCFQYADTRCAVTIGCNYTDTCPPTNGCPPQTNGCPPQTDGCPFISQSCPVNGIC